MSAALEHLGRISREYAVKTGEYGPIAEAAAVAEAAHKTARAKAILRYRATEGVRSHAEAETRAEADDEIADLYQARLVAAAKADSHREHLRQLREQVAVGRSKVASERADDQFHARGHTGAA